jgi:hypothetical protein
MRRTDDRVPKVVPAETALGALQAQTHAAKGTAPGRGSSTSTPAVLDGITSVFLVEACVLRLSTVWPDSVRDRTSPGPCCR